jgi:hypothetical protein
MKSKEIKEVNSVNPFTKGVLLHVRIRCGYGATAKVPEGELKTATMPEEMVRGMYDILKSEAMDVLKTLPRFRSRVKNFIRGISIPYPIENLDFIRKSQIEYAEERLQGFKKEFMEVVEIVVENFPQWVKDFEESYPENFNPKKYPTQEGLRQYFSFDWSYRAFQVPDKALSVLSPNIYKQEQEKFKAEVREMQKMALAEVQERIIDRLNVLKEQCLTDNINSSTVNSVQNMLEKIDTVFDGFIANTDMVEMINQVKVYMSGVDGDMLKADDEFRTIIGKKMGEVLEGVENLPEEDDSIQLDI